MTDNWEIVITYNKEGIKENKTIANEAKNFPKMILDSFSGNVERISIVPDLNSSENERMVSAGIKNMITHGAILKNRSKVAYPSLNILESGLIHKKIPMITINKRIEIYAINELKYEFNSLIKILNINNRTNKLKYYDENYFFIEIFQFLTDFIKLLLILTRFNLK